MKKNNLQRFSTICLLIVSTSCSFSQKFSKVIHSIPAEYDAIYTDVQRTTFQYFWDGAEPVSGLARERFHVDGIYPENDKNVVTTGGEVLV